MGRLFWKFFLCILLAQIAATIGIGGAFWLKNRAIQQQRAEEIDTSPPAQMAIEAATATLEAGGSAALKHFIGKLDRMRVVAIDQHGKELMGRSIHPAMLNKARALLEQEQSRPVVREATGSDGVRYLLFLPYSERFRNAQLGAAREALNAVTMAGPRMLPPAPRDPAQNGSGREIPRPDGAPPGAAPGMDNLRNQLPGPGMGGPGPRMDSPYRNLVPIIAATIASLLFAFLLAWYFSRPIRALRLAFEAASNGDLAPRFQASGRGDELSDLGRDFDRMTGRLRSLMDSQTRLLHDVSHELRSPLARLQAAIGLAHQQPDKLDASLARIEREGVRMDKLIGELLTLSRMEAGAGKALYSDFCLADLLHDIVEDACYEAEARGITLDVGGDAGMGEVMVSGQPELLARAVENVVRNAVKHSPDHGAVQLELALLPEASQVRITVLDRGPGVPAADLDHIFQPFFRSSNTENSTDGHGLGLAIARHVIEAHGGTISARNRSSGGFCVEMVLTVKSRRSD
ncbi:ATP-binding protein [Janthinobacterium aquaticum]|uniref:ATP-binding protein n=1 Tax=Janthinobacterium sp. FT58W TaxID=2654254 RepID=UPI001265740A|nr:ATP-binding protein [Janthinobacterium sp. FT58W]KAB8044913.1 HAMP domain-containing protein [Janthinobacterium sp. FT58W]